MMSFKFTGYGQKLSSCHMHPPNFEYLKSGLLGNDEALKGYLDLGNKLKVSIWIIGLMTPKENQ